MSKEKEVFGRRPAGRDPVDEPEGPNAERLRSLRDQAGDFDAVIGRALASSQNRKTSAKDILKSIRNPGGE